LFPKDGDIIQKIICPGQHVAGEIMTDKRKPFAILILPLLLLFTACAPISPDQVNGVNPEATLVPEALPTVESTATISPLEQYYVPPYYSQFYGEIIEDSKAESGLLVYSIMDEKNWEPVLRAFKEHYPWINVATREMSADEIFERYTDNIDTGIRTADIVISPDMANWQNFIEQGQVLTYQSPEESYLPNWTKAGSGIYAVSSEPLLIIYNKQIIAIAPETMQELADLTSTYEIEYRELISTFDAGTSATGYAANWFWIKSKGEPGWDILNAIGKTAPVLNTPDAQMLQDVASGKFMIGYFVPSYLLMAHLDEYPNLGWSYIKDGQPILMYNMAITQANYSPNSAKLFLDFLLSQEGQLSLSRGGLTSYRPDIARVSDLHVENVFQLIGPENIIFSSLDPELRSLPLSQAFLERWLPAMNQTP
jgi:iron(III) transport system substrate-binding protein